MAEHSGTHIDALCHQAEGLHLHGDVAVDARLQTSKGFTDHDAASLEPIVGRGVLIDVANDKGVDVLEEGYTVTGADLESAVERHKIDLRLGDVVLVRTGNGSLWEQPARYEKGSGVGADGSRWLAERRPLAVGCDNLAWDVHDKIDPHLGSLPGHLILIVRAGILIIENLMLEQLSRERVTEFLFVCTPLKMKGATGSPVRPLAIVAAK